MYYMKDHAHHLGDQHINHEKLRQVIRFTCQLSITPAKNHISAWISSRREDKECILAAVTRLELPGEGKLAYVE